ncbi:phosphoenolpyruvate synthase [Longitalea arenae]|uniref:phosphoenolpyruvate synthase n=1 Tax=Longitalea arenae TaxID=2812558 RepID=UPI001F07A88A|nr:phosphoenolpyruvate synthase [Longitalea arenae]
MSQMIRNSSLVLPFQELDSTQLMLAGGKGAKLGELSRIGGILVPPGFCVTTEAYKRMLEYNPVFDSFLDELNNCKADERERMNQLSAAVRTAIEKIPVPHDLAEEIAGYLSKLGDNDAYAVRSSATAEDLPTASFAGQQDTYLNVIGVEAILQQISRCWASLFTARAVSYRMQNGFDHRKVQLAVVIQKMVFPQASGILFTADPVTGNRKVVSIDASFGLGEALVGGLVNADVYKVREGKLIDKQIAVKKLAVEALKEGGTVTRAIEADKQQRQTLTDEQIITLEGIGRKIEKHFGQPQDIEWCLVDNTFYIVQSRPITTLFPIPQADDARMHVYVSVGHQQMMTDAIKPLGLSVWQLTAARPMYTAGGRLFVDISEELASPAKREVLVNVLGKSDPLMRDAFMNIIARGDLIQSGPDDEQQPAGNGNQGPPPINYQTLQDYDPAIVTELIERSEASIRELEESIQAKSGAELIDFILEEKQAMGKRRADMQGFGVVMTAMNASAWINEKIFEWLGEKNVADTLTLSVPHNITSEMGLALLDVADVIRPYPEVIAYLQQVKEDNFLDGLLQYRGGRETRQALDAFLDKYGMRCAGEIDITRPRWREKPLALVPVILNNIKNLQPGASHRKFEQGRQQALRKEQEILDRLQQLPDGAQKARETKRMIDLVRNFIGYREYPKYAIVSRYFVYKKALLKEAEKLVQAGLIHENEEIYYLTVEELGEVIRTSKLDHQLINQRKAEQRYFEKLTPPRVITSDGEIITGQYKRGNLPAGAIVGLPVSSGCIEGRARVVLKIEDADLEAGDILVTAFTDPSWTPLFVGIKGLVTEVGGLMTHGAVIAREYGLPAVVGVENATKLIQDGQRIRVHGTEGYIELL